MEKNILILGGASYLAKNYLNNTKCNNTYYSLDIKNLQTSTIHKKYAYSYHGSATDACLLKYITETHNINTVLHFACPKILTSNQLETYLSHYSIAVLPMVFFYDYSPDMKQIVIATEPTRLQGVDSYKLAKIAQKEFCTNKPNLYYLEFNDFGNHNELSHLIPHNEKKDNIQNLVQTINNSLY